MIDSVSSSRSIPPVAWGGSIDVDVLSSRGSVGSLGTRCSIGIVRRSIVGRSIVRSGGGRLPAVTGSPCATGTASEGTRLIVAVEPLEGSARVAIDCLFALGPCIVDTYASARLDRVVALFAHDDEVRQAKDDGEWESESRAGGAGGVCTIARRKVEDEEQGDVV